MSVILALLPSIIENITACSTNLRENVLQWQQTETMTRKMTQLLCIVSTNQIETES